jgi:hypothetical protein
MEPEPQQPVSHGQQLFSTGDLKALLAASYADGPAIALGGRCHERDVKRDTRGRILAGDCRDMGPQGFHVALTNLLGLYRRAFAEDRASGGRPLSRPIRGFEITSLRDQLTVPRRPLANLIVELRHNGQRRILHNRAGRSTDGLDSEYQVSEFNGSNINGAWELFVSDNARSDTGEIVQWEMTAEVL